MDYTIEGVLNMELMDLPVSELREVRQFAISHVTEEPQLQAIVTEADILLED